MQKLAKLDRAAHCASACPEAKASNAATAHHAPTAATRPRATISLAAICFNLPSMQETCAGLEMPMNGTLV